MRARLFVLAILLYFLATLIFLYPLPFHLSDRLFENGDSYLNVWILSWETHALTMKPGQLFDGNIFFPEANALALSELMLPDLAIFAPILALTHNPLIAYNTTLILTFPLSAISMLALAYYLTHHFPAAWLAGFIFGFTPIRLSHLHHVQLLSLMWLPLILLFFDRWLHRSEWRDAMVTGIFFVLQYLTTVYVALYLIPILAVYFLVHFLLTRKWTGKVFLQAVVTMVCAVLVLAPFLRHYYVLHQEWNFIPPESLKVYFSSDLWSNLFAVFPSNLIYGKLLHSLSGPPYERFYFTGFLTILLVLLAWGLRREYHVRIFFALSAAGYLIALGPFLQVSGHITKVPLPYQWLVNPLPGFSMLRVPARAGLILLASMSILAAYGWIHLYELLKRKWDLHGWKMISGTLVCVATAVLLGLEFLSIPLPLLSEVSGNRIPPAYQFLETYRGPGGILEIPVVFQEGGGEPTVRSYTYFAAYHLKPIVIGYSGYFPPPFYELVATARRLPAEEALDVFEAIGVRTIVLHRQQMSLKENQAWQSALSSSTRLKQVEEFPDGDEVLAIEPRLRISQNLTDAYWNLIIHSPAPARKRQIEASLQTDGLRSPSIDFLVNPQLPHPPDRPQARVGMTPVAVEWLDSQRRVVYRQALKVRLPYLLNRVALPLQLETPRQPGDYSLRLVLLESPSMGISVNVSIP
ncbi:MAG: YfhO family protein [Acidobacteriia bacterium]|nr:YfhO family protein [Terriglobia bacterium]